MTTVNLNQSPYFDDFNENKKFYQILFRPGRAVQARELNQIQSLLKSQLERLGKFVFDNGTVVYPIGSEEAAKYINNVGFIKLLSSTSLFTDTEDNLKTYWLGKKIIGTAGLYTGVTAEIIGVRPADSLGEVRLFLNYVEADTTGVYTKFAPEQTITTVENAPISATISAGSYKVGTVSAAKIQKSIFFYNGRFVLVDEQLLFIAPEIDQDQNWTNIPTVSIGLEFIESLETWIEDSSLLDNATGSPNIGAPGADRLRIAANLIQLPINSTTNVQDYVELLKIQSGEVTKRSTKTDLSDLGLEKQLATRTFEESGDYTVLSFQIQIKDFLRNSSNVNGANAEEIFQYDTPAAAAAASVQIFGLESPGLSVEYNGKNYPGASYNSTAPAEQPSFISLCNDRLGIVVDPGLAYVKGYRIEKTSTTNVPIKKARDLKFRNNNFISTPLGNYIFVKNIFGGLTSTYDSVDLHDAPITTRGSSSGTKIGTARVLTIENFSGYRSGSTNDTRFYRLFLFNVQMIGSNDFAQVKSIYSSNPSFTCDVELERFRLTGSVSRVPNVIRTGNITNNSKVVANLSTTRDLYVGMSVTGTGVSSKIYSIDSETQITLIANATATTTGVSLTFIGEKLLLGTGTSWRNDESQLLSAGDYIEVDAGQPTSKIYKVSANPTSDNILQIVESTLTHTWTNGAKIDYLYTLLRTDSKNAGLVYKLPDSPVATIRTAYADGSINSEDSGIDTTYTVRKIASDLQPSGNKLTISGISGSQFEPFSQNSYSVIKTTKVGTGANAVLAGTWLQVLPYSAGTPSAGFAEIRPNIGTNNNLEIWLNSDDADSGDRYQVHYTTTRLGGSASKEKLKNLAKGTFNLVSGAYQDGGVVVTAGADVAEISLGKPDVLRITRIVESSDYSITPSDNKNLTGTGSKDITGIYSLDNGQRDHYYDIAKVTLRPGYAKPRGRVRVEFDYFEHTENGEYFSVNSYPFVGGTNPQAVMEYGDIPIFTATDGSTYDLASSLDFRPVVGTSGINGTIARELGIPKESVRCDYHFYLPRKDLLVLDPDTKDFYIKYGKSDESPVFPSDPDRGMVVYELDVGAYTFSTKHVSPKMRENKRYTMKDIGKLENRISNLEYYTSLSLLEKDTNSLTVKDALGRDRFKNGFLVDNFKTFSASDLSSRDFKCALDTFSGMARPIIHEDPNPPKLFERALLFGTTTSEIANQTAINSRRASKNYQKTGEIYTLPYTTQTFIDQPLASKFVNVNPYSVFVFVGSVDIDPWTDEWRDTRIAEPINIKDESQWQATRGTFGPSGTRIDYSTTVNNWTGVNTTTVGTGRQVLEKAGHAIREKYFPNITKAKWNKMDFITVPEGYANAGERIPIDRKSWVSEETQTTTTQTGERITTNFTSSFVDQGFSAPINLGERIIDTAMAEFIRSKTINFVGRGFKPKARVYPFFDGVNVSTYCRPIGGAVGAALICDGTGTVSGSFTIPSPTETGLRFKTGERIFRLTTSSINSLNPAPDSAGDARYVARGWIDTKQQTTLSTRMFTVANNTTTSSDPISQVLSTTFGDTQAVPQDPLAQSFLIKEKGGCFITSVDVYFATRPSDVLNAPPITLQLRPMSDDGFPTYKILPFGEVIKDASEVITNHFNLNNQGELNGTLTITGPGGPWLNGESNNSGNFVSGIATEYSGNPRSQLVPTRFTFKSPVYVAEGQYYSIVLIANSTEYNVWVAESGTDDTKATKPFNVEIGTQIPINQPVFLDGLLFYSENGINWVQTPKQDMKFRVNKAVFNTAVTGEIDYVNEELSLKALTLDPFEFLNSSDSSQTGSIRVLHPNHGHTTARTSGAGASKVVFSPAYDTTITGITSVGTTLTGAALANIPDGAYIQHPTTKENRRITKSTPTATTATIRTQFYNNTVLSASMVIPATTFNLPSAGNLGGLNSDVIFDYQGFEVQSTELDYYTINVGKPRGVVFVTNGSTTVTGSNTQFDVDYVVGDTILIAGASYIIASISTSSQLTLTSNYTGITVQSPTPGLPISKSGRYGGNKILATENKRYEELTLLTTPLEFPDTQISWNIQTISGCGVNDSSTQTYRIQPRKTLFANEKLIFDNPMLVASYINELPSVGLPPGPANSYSTDDQDVGARKSIQVRAILKSSNPNISPIVDESRMTAMLISNRLDDPRGLSVEGVNPGQVINTALDDYQVVPTTVSPATGNTNGKLYFTTSAPQATGTVTGTAGSRVLTGNSDTIFREQIRVGDTVTTTAKESRKVVSVVSDSELLLDYPLNVGFSGALYINSQNLKIKTADGNIAKHLSNLDVGKYVTITGSSSGSRDIGNPSVATSGQPALILAVNYTPNNTTPDTDLSGSPKLIEIEIDRKILGTSGSENSNITITQKDRFVDEISPDAGSCGSKYISKKLVVSRPSNALKIMFEGSRDETCAIELYYKLELVNASTPFESTIWTKATFNTEVNGAYVDATPGPNLSNLDFSDYECTLGGLPAFTGAQAKIVMRGGNPARAVRVKNFRMLILDE